MRDNKVELGDLSQKTRPLSWGCDLLVWCLPNIPEDQGSLPSTTHSHRNTKAGLGI